MASLEELHRARELAEAGELDQAWDVVGEHMKTEPNDVKGLLLATFIMDKSKRLPIAYQLARRVIDMFPNVPEGWINFGRMAEQLYRFEESEAAYLKAVDLSTRPESTALAFTNLGALYISWGKWDEAKAVSEKAIALNPEGMKALGNLGTANLALHNWKEGWKGYEAIVGSPYRLLVKYRNEPVWNGQKDSTLVVYGEQGLGDEISFASMLPDVIKDSKRVIIDCDHRLKGLFERSFPQAKVYGTRWHKGYWEPEDKNPDYSITMGGLGKFYRNSDTDFPRKAYLKPCPDRVEMWKALFRSKRKPVIGLAWSGGVETTNAGNRKWSLDQLAPILSMDAHFVSLQYKDASEEVEGTKVVQYPFGTLTDDYDDTAALVASVDMVICMQTAVAHLAGAIGKSVWVFVPEFSQWRYGMDDVPWYPNLKVWRQRNGEWPIEQAAEQLRHRLKLITGKAA